MAALLEAKNVTKIYAKSQHPSLNKVSFSVTDGEFIAIMGASSGFTDGRGFVIDADNFHGQRRS